MVDTVQYANQISGKISLDNGIVNSDTKVLYAEYDASALAANGVINVIKALKGIVIYDIIVDTGALGSGVTLNVGDAETVDRYINGANVAAATTVRLGKIGGRGYRIGTNAGDDVIQAKVLGASATGKLKFTVIYSV